MQVYFNCAKHGEPYKVVNFTDVQEDDNGKFTHIYTYYEAPCGCRLEVATEIEYNSSDFARHPIRASKQVI